MSYRCFETDILGQPLKVEVGKYAFFANGSCLVRCGNTAVLTAVTMSGSAKSDIDFFPLVVDFDEKLYAVGRIPGSFSRREGKPSEKAILLSRLIDRSIRPLFPKYLRNEVSVMCTPLSVSDEFPVEIASIIGSSISLAISDVPWNGPISSSLVGSFNQKLDINPSKAKMENSDLHLVVSSTYDKILMIEAGANQISDDTMLDSIIFAHKENKKIIDFINQIVSEVGKEKYTFECPYSENLELKEKVLKFSEQKIESSLCISDKQLRDHSMNEVYDEVLENFSSEYPEDTNYIRMCLDDIQKSIVRRWIFDLGKRVDGRSLDQIRDLSAEVALLPQAHGSALFSRGKTQVLSIATLATLRDCQLIDGIFQIQNKYYMHHYNFPSYSVGESRPSRAPGRREIGHGALAEKALYPVIPPVSKFPYTIRVVSEVLSSNGSTSQASVCGSTLALMDAGVPISAPVAGISCGLVTKGDSWKTFVDIQGIEDFFGDMDFKVAGTREGITAIQVDVKIDGLLPEIVKDAIYKTHEARIKILDDCMLKILSHPREEISKNAPKIVTYQVSVDKIRDIVGPSGRTVQKLCSDFNVVIDIEDDGKIYISSREIENCNRALDQIILLSRDLLVGDIVTGKITKITNFGVFAEISPGKEGMCHISKLSDRRVERITDILKLGDIVTFKITDIDPKGRIDLRRISANSSFS